jgi:hypothetical protein
MAETPERGKVANTAESEPRTAGDRGIARAHLQRRIELAKNNPHWHTARTLASILEGPEANSNEIDMRGLELLERKILTVVDLFREFGRQER